MTRLEFTTWLKRLASLFPTVPEKFGNLSEEQREAVKAEWYDCLKNVAAEDAEAATTAIFRGDQKRPYHFFDQIAMTTRRIAYSLQAERRVKEKRRHFTVTGTVSYNCSECLDTGFLVKPILETSHGERAREFYKENAVKYTAAVRCGCRR